MVTPRQASLRRLDQFDVHPRRELGQNFLIDSNILGVIERAAELAPTDIVLEVGGGLGVLSEYLAARAGHVHVVEIDRRLEPALRDALDPYANASLHLADAMDLDFAALDPPVGKVVANLPYNVAAGVILRTVGTCPSRAGWRWCSARSASGSPPPPAAGVYGIPSVLAQVACEVSVLRPCPDGLPPGPHVDSVLLGLAAAPRRRRPPCAPWWPAPSPTGARPSPGRWP